MQIGIQIKKYRKLNSFSQDDLAQKVFVSRQSISNWETNKTYPDINSLLLLSELFSISLDELVKGDIEIMKKEINIQEFTQFQKDSVILTILFIAIFILPIPLAKLLGWTGLAIYLIIFVITLFYALRIEMYKKRYDIQTYKEIVSFVEGNNLNEIEKAKEEGKRPYQKFLLPVASVLLVSIISIIMIWVLK